MLARAEPAKAYAPFCLNHTKGCRVTSRVALIENNCDIISLWK
jgi:hypothetical protein